jgi:hypothetical protein
MDIDLLEVIEDEPMAVKNNGGLRVAVYARTHSGDWALLSLNVFPKESDLHAFCDEVDFNVQSTRTSEKLEMQ